MTNLESILKSRDITLPTKVRLVKAMVFPVVMYGCESWTVKKAERRKIDAFELLIYFFILLLTLCCLGGFPGGSDSEESACNAGDRRDPGSSSALERSLEEVMASQPVFLPGEFHGQRSLAVHGVANSQT